MEAHGAIICVQVEESSPSQGFWLDTSFPSGVGLMTSSIRYKGSMDMDGIGGRGGGDRRSDVNTALADRRKSLTRSM